MNQIEMITKLLNESGKSQKELCDYLNLGKSTYSNWKNGSNTSYKKYLFQIANFFNVNITCLLLPDNWVNASYEEMKVAKTEKEGAASSSNESNSLLLRFNLLHKEQQEQVKDYIEFLLSQNTNKEGN